MFILSVRLDIKNKIHLVDETLVIFNARHKYEAKSFLDIYLSDDSFVEYFMDEESEFVKVECLVLTKYNQTPYWWDCEEPIFYIEIKNKDSDEISFVIHEVSR